MRHVCWSAYLLRYNNKTGLLDPITCTHAPYSHYYAQEEVDDGIMMETDVTVKEVCNYDEDDHDHPVFCIHLSIIINLSLFIPTFLFSLILLVEK